jgi:formylglycine-generating enzyme required for sulfatase activity
MILIPAGEFLMGSDPDKDAHARPEEQPQHTFYLPDYTIARTPVTNAQYKVFVRATRHNSPDHWRWLFWKRRRPPKQRIDHPVVNVTYDDAQDYCRWLTDVTGKSYRLPNEAEWEKAARSTDGRLYPWGNAWDGDRCNVSGGSDLEDTTPVGAYPAGASLYGLLDTVGNVWEWTRSLWGPRLREPQFTYPYDPDDGRENAWATSDVRRVLRGASFFNGPEMARCAARYRYSPKNWFRSIGFRVVISSSLPASG